jgi:hypothetical protein
MNNIEEKELKNMISGFLEAYAERDQSVDFPGWLSDRLQEEMPNMSAEASGRLAAEIIESIAEYDRTLGELNDAIEAGQSKESWLADRLTETCADMPDNEAGTGLRCIYNDLNASNGKLMQELEDEFDGNVIDVEATEIVEWNEYNLMDEALNVGKQAATTGLAVLADGVKASLESGEAADMGEIIGQALQESMDVAKDEVKAVVAGAVRVAANKGLTEMLPADTPTEVIGDVAGAAVESAGAMLDLAMGKTTMVEAMEQVGRANVAAACRLGARLLRGVVFRIPYVGPLIAVAANGLFKHFESPKFADNIYPAVRNAAKTAWEGIKQTGKALFNKAKNFAALLFG